MLLRVSEVVDLIDDAYDEYSDPLAARGECYVTSADIRSLFNFDTGLDIIRTQHHNNPGERFKEKGQHNDHYAVYIKADGLVVDYTLRQFKEATPFPFIGTKSEWLGVLSEAWEYDQLLISTLDQL